MRIAPSTADTLKDKGGKIIWSKKRHLDYWRKHFSEKLKPAKASYNLPPLSSTTMEPDNINLDPPSITEVIKELKYINIKNTPREDGILSEIYKAFPTLLYSTCLYRSRWQMLSQKTVKYHFSFQSVKHGTRLFADTWINLRMCITIKYVQNRLNSAQEGVFLSS
jgi:hypothetical protein